VKIFLLVFSILIASLPGLAFAAPGAHGPGGEHLDAPAQTASGVAAARVEASSELFELVGRLEGAELSIMVDRFETNEPVLGADVSVQLGSLKAKAAFHSDRGDYSMNDPALLKALSAPGEHPLIFSVVAGKDSDLLEGTLTVGKAVVQPRAESHAHWLGRLLAAAAVAVVAALIFFAWKRRRSRLMYPALLLAVLIHFPPSGYTAPGAHGPGGEHLSAPGAGTSALARLPDGSVNLPKSAQRRLEIRTMLAPVSEAAATMELPGRVIMDPNAGGRVQAVHGGRLEPAPAGLPVAGQRVVKGQVLAYVRHHADPYAQSNQVGQLTELRASLTLAQQKVNRLESLEGTVPRKEIEAARVELQSLTARELSVGASLASRETMVAPVTGVVAVTNVVSGQVVEARDVLFEVIDPGRLLVEALVADVSLADRVASGHLLGQPGIGMRVIGVGRSLREGVLPITFRVENAKDGRLPALAIGQPVVVLAVLRERIRGIVLPAAAVVRNPANEPIVWIKAGAERYVSQPVQFKPIDAQNIVVTAGLAAGNRVVIRGGGLISQIR